VTIRREGGRAIYIGGQGPDNKKRGDGGKKDLRAWITKRIEGDGAELNLRREEEGAEQAFRREGYEAELALIIEEDGADRL
jgi:hypothetical protein